MGTPEFAVASLDALVKNKFDVVGVVTSADKPAGRGQQLHQSAVKKYALENNLKLLQPEKLKDEHFLSELKSLEADVQFVVAFRMLPEAVWNMPPLGTYNLHASLLPKYRGAAPINWAIIKGERETGVTTFKLKHAIDTGNILFSEKVPIGTRMTAGELHDVLMVKGAELLVKTANEIQRNKDEQTPIDFAAQDDRSVSHAPKLFKETCRLDWNKTAAELFDLIRGLSPYPAAFTRIHDQEGKPLLLKILAGEIESKTHTFTNGTLFTDAKTFLKVACKDGFVSIIDLQLEGKKRMRVEEFLRGFKVTAGSMAG